MHYYYYYYYYYYYFVTMVQLSSGRIYGAESRTYSLVAYLSH